MTALHDSQEMQINIEPGNGETRWKKILDRERITLANALIRPTIDWVLPGLPAGSVGAIVGPGGTGKSFLAIGIGAVVGCGVGMLGEMFHSEKKGKVTIYFGEDSRAIVLDRLHSFRQNLSQETIELFDKNVTIVSGQGSLCQLMDKNGDHGEFYDVFLEAACSARLLILDPFSRLHGADENDNAAMTRMLQILESISKKTGATILIVHHTGKAATYNAAGEMGNQGASRGASALSSGLRWQVNMWTPNSKEATDLGIENIQQKFWVRTALVKSNYNSPVEDQWLRRGDSGILRYAEIPAAEKSRPFKERKKTVGYKEKALGANNEAEYYFPSQ